MARATQHTNSQPLALATLQEEKFIFRTHRSILSLQRQRDIRAKSGTGKKIDCPNPKQLALARFIISFLNGCDFSAGGSARSVALETAACSGDRDRVVRSVASSRYPCQQTSNPTHRDCAQTARMNSALAGPPLFPRARRGCWALFSGAQ